jgi:glutathione peroxidase-family protein
MTTALYDVPVKRADGTSTTLTDYKGSVLLIVNVASECGLTPQYSALGPKRFRDASNQGLRVMADITLDPQPSTLDRGSAATFGCGGAVL